MALIAAKAIEKRKPPFLPDEVFEKLKCSDCKGILSTPPIYKHSELGSICGNCAVYTDKKDYIRNTEYETLAAYIEFPCNNEGCHKRILFGKLSEHEFVCQFKLYDCPLKQCQWIGFHQKLGTHFSQNHETNIITDGCFKPNFSKTCEEIKLDQRDNNTFLVQSKCIISEHKFWCLIRYLGTSNKKSKVFFNYKLEFQGNTRSRPFFSEEKSVQSNVCFLMDTISAVEINIIQLLKHLNCPTNVNCIIHIKPIIT